MSSDALIPGEPVLDQFIKPAQETIGVGLLKKMGWKPGQGIGPKLTRSKKKQSSRATKRLFGPALPSDSRRGAVCYSTNLLELDFEIYKSDQFHFFSIFKDHQYQKTGLVLTIQFPNDKSKK